LRTILLCAFDNLSKLILCFMQRPMIWLHIFPLNPNYLDEKSIIYQKMRKAFYISDKLIMEMAKGSLDFPLSLGV
jgi:hypothetical protein